MLCCEECVPAARIIIAWCLPEIPVPAAVSLSVDVAPRRMHAGCLVSAKATCAGCTLLCCCIVQCCCGVSLHAACRTAHLLLLFKGLPCLLQVPIAAAVCQQRKLSPEVARLFTEGAPDEVNLPNCVQLKQECLADALREAGSPR